MPSPKRIGQIEFGLLSPKEIREMSVRKIIWADTYDDDGFPYPQGLMDLNLGVIDPGLRCKTCDQKAGECPGHFGHIELAKPVIHVGHTRLIRKLLRVTCRSCGRVLLSPEEIEKVVGTEDDQTGDLHSEKDVKKERICPHCGDQQLKINFEKPTTFSEVVVEYGRMVEHKLTPADIRARMEKIPDEDLILLGIKRPDNARPEWTILTVLPVPPVTMRPSIILENGQRSEDDLTHKLVDIIRINQRFKEHQYSGAPQLIIEDLWELLQYHVTTYMDNEVVGCPPARHRSGRPLKTLSQRLKGKDGRFRGSLSGKRVNFSSRTVISPDPNLSVRQVGVPKAVANEMTVPVRVTIHNIERLKQIVRTGPVRPDINAPCGANYVIRPDGRRLRLEESNLDIVTEMIEPGWTVERHLMDGDVVLFNRQPSLHRMSIMAHRVKVMEGKTFRLNPAVCPPYNADFDGDEMNMHVQQTEEARAEATILMSVQENILSPRFGGPIVGGIQDHISGMFMLTHDTRWFTKDEALYLLRYTGIERMPAPGKIEGGIDYWSNKQVFSIILPANINMFFQARFCVNCEICKKELCERDAYVSIIDGILVSGTIDKKAIGAFDGQIINHIIRQEGMSRATDFIDDISKLSIRAIMFDGFSFGIDDEDLSKDEYGQIDELLKNAALDVDRRIKIYEDRQLEPMPGRTVEETLEMQIMQVLGKARDLTGEIAGRHLGLGNSAVLLAVSGATGSMLNLTQMAGCIGQQSVRGERIFRGYDDRTLPHFRKGERGSDAHGFIQHSYKGGLNPTEFFFHAIGGQESLVNTAVRTSQSGYLQRRLINALQNLKVAYDGTVRSIGGKIIQFEYGEDGTDPSKTAYGESVDVKGIIESVLKEEVCQNSVSPIIFKQIKQGRAEHIINDGENLDELKRYSENLANLNEQISVNQIDADSLYNCGIALVNLDQHSEDLAILNEQISINPIDAFAHYNHGVVLDELCKYSEAIASYDKAVALKPDYFEAWYNRGIALEELGQYREAVASYDQAITLNPDYFELWYNHGVALANLGQYLEAIDSYDRAIAIKPDYIDALFSRGLAFNKLGLYEDAIDSFEKEITIDPKDAFALYHLGVALERLRRNEEALVSYEKAITIKPDYAAARANRDNIIRNKIQQQAAHFFEEGVAFFNLQRYSDALASFDKAISINPDYVEAWAFRGKVLAKLEQYTEAFVSFDRALAINPHFAYTWNYRGVVLGNLGRDTEAFASFNRAVEINPDYSESWFYRSLALQTLGRHEEALYSFDKLITISPGFVDAWYFRGVTLGELERYREAVASFDRAIAINPNYAKVWYNRGDALVKLERYEEAIDSYEKVIAINPDFANAWYSRGTMLHQLGRNKEAVYSFDRVITIEPNNAYAWISRGIALNKLGLYDEEISCYDRAISIQSNNAIAWYYRGIVLNNLNRHAEAVASYDRAIEIEPNFPEAWKNREIALQQQKE